MEKFKCLCCGYRTLDTRGGYDICPVCFWEDDAYLIISEDSIHVMERDSDCEADTYSGADVLDIVSDANHGITLRQGRENYKKFGACEEDMIPYVRKPAKGEDDMSKIKLGSHVGMAGKEMFLASVKEAESYGANVLMLYTGAPQNTRRKEIEELNIDKGWEYAKKAGIEEIVVHAPYIINLGNTVKPETFELATEFLKKEIKRTAAMRSKILVLHPGSHVNAGVEAGIAQVVKGLNLVLDENNDDVLIALETMAGKGSELGRTFEELKMIYDGVNKKDRLRVCFDTCHVNDAGYDIVQNYEGVLQEFDKIIGLEQIAVIHVNDSLNPCGAHKDRHANIGKGFIGFETLNKIVHYERFADVPKILETPWLCEEGSEKKTIPPYKEEIAKLLGE